ncbi:hypothetical protein SteCoe_26888 [Stentor coeruleus]|uniref:Ubiquitin-like domain-containing protein n=1 Tax=Stentor coeruleus TaxID=5963 RepID=A0A1R2BBS2_9CILI|nr:hypothetical protein SteCoe_26888 [Stentor coeruleus]
MEKDYIVFSLERDPFELQFINETLFAERIEEITGIFSVRQEYYKLGKKIKPSQLKNTKINTLSVINNRISANKYLISLPSGHMHISIAHPEDKTIKDLAIFFHIESKNKGLNFPLSEHSFYYNQEFLPFDYKLSQIPDNSTIDLIQIPIYTEILEKKMYICSYTGQQLEINFYDNQTISIIKEEIQKIISLPIDQQRLIFSGKQLENEKTISYYNIQNESKLNLFLRIIGGGGPQIFSFNEMSNQIKIEFSQKAPKWRIVQKGISFRGICKNKQCPACDHEVICNLGFGIFDIKVQAGVLLCPICKCMINNVRNCGFFMAEYEHFGIDSQGVERRGRGESYENNYATFLDGDNEQWRILRIAVGYKK